jgi:hypothetical protein
MAIAGFGRDAERAEEAAKREQEAREEALAVQEKFNEALKESEQLSTELAELARKSKDIREEEGDITKALTASEEKRAAILNKIAELNEAIGKAKGDDKKALEEVKKKLEDNFKSQEGSIEASKKQAKMTGALKKRFMDLGKAVLDGYVSALIDADKQIAETGRNLGISREEAFELRRSFSAAADASNDLAVNATRLIAANNELNDQLGTAQKFSAETAGTFSKLTQITGISADAASNLAFAATNAGKNFREVNENVLGASFELQKQVGINLSNKKVLEAVGKVTGQVRANFAANPESIAVAVTKAKLLGAEIDDIVAASKQLLDFESSIEAELEAELLTGKQLNLERARAAALVGDQATVAEELAKNVGDFAEFSNMNVLQQDAIAKSMGMSSDQLADMLFKQETMNMNAEQLRAIGKDELADQLEQRSLDEQRALAQEKFANALADTAMVVGDIMGAFNGVYQFLFGSKEALSIMVGLGTTLLGIFVALSYQSMIVAAKSVITAVSSIFTTLAGIPFGLGLAAAAGVTAGLFSYFGKATTSAQAMAQGGIVMPRPGGTTAVIGEAGQPEAVIPLNKAKQMGFGGGGQNTSQPIIIKNTFDAFAAANGNGRRGLGGTQELQASPTFA